VVSFDTIDHDFLLRTLGDAPGRELVRQWLKAGVLEDGAFHATPTGTPQGGVISPLLLNIALHGLEAALGVTYQNRGEVRGTRAVVRYADDFVVFCETQESARYVKEVLLPVWLAQRGLSLSSEKTRIVHLTEGFDFLSFNVRHHQAPRTSRTGYKLLIRPSKQAVRKKRWDLREVWLRLKGHNLNAVLRKLNPIIRGWADYFRFGVASRTFRALDAWMFRREQRYVKHTHPTKPWKWRKAKYFGRLNPFRKDNNVFGNKVTGRHLLKFSWFKIVRHPLVQGTASPDDPSRRAYWAERQIAKAMLRTPSDWRIAQAQRFLCPGCGEFLFNDEEIQRHHIEPKKIGGKNTYTNLEFRHLYCHQQETARQAQRAVPPADEQLFS
jgi:RNA-directed DNA polymerase